MADQSYNFCPACGARLRGNARFCNSCGASLNPGACTWQQPSSPTTPQPNPVIEPRTPQPRSVFAPRTPQPNSAPAGRSVAGRAPASAVNPQNAAATKIKRYPFLRLILVAACAAMLYIIWKDGVRNVENAMTGPSAFTEPVSGDEDPEQLQMIYDELYANPPEVPETEPLHPDYEWLYKNTEAENGG